jgi:hypothetical protein
MANVIYPKGAEKILSADINFVDDTIKVALLPSGYTYSAAHEFLDDLGTTLGTAQTLANKSITGGAFGADAITFTTVASGSTYKAVALYQDTGTAGTSPLLAYIDTITGFPGSTNGGNQAVTWPTTGSKIFKL